tara:strand:+ start:1801 stop:2097 length:297 start_codon:yes stop_codon:yes gene_type:complete
MENKNLFFNFIYLFKAPVNDSNLVSIFEMADLFYQSTPDISSNLTKPLDNLSLNEELFYTKLRTVIEKCYNEYVKKEKELLNTLINLLKNNHLIKKSL